MPYVYQVYVQYFNEEDNRFWFDTFQVISDEPLAGYQVFREADQLIAQKLSASKYESLRQYLARGDFEPTEQITGAYFLPP